MKTPQRKPAAFRLDDAQHRLGRLRPRPRRAAGAHPGRSIPSPSRRRPGPGARGGGCDGRGSSFAGLGGLIALAIGLAVDSADPRPLRPLRGAWLAGGGARGPCRHRRDRDRGPRDRRPPPHPRDHHDPCRGGRRRWPATTARKRARIARQLIVLYDRPPRDGARPRRPRRPYRRDHRRPRPDRPRRERTDAAPRRGGATARAVRGTSGSRWSPPSRPAPWSTSCSSPSRSSG